MRLDTLSAVNVALAKARAKHPRFVRGRLHLAGVLLEEVWEFLWALLRGNKQRAREEAADCIAVLVRWMEGK